MSCFYACIIRYNILSLYLQEAPGVRQLWLYGVQTSNLCNVSSIHRLHVSSEILTLAVKENVLPVNKAWLLSGWIVPHAPKLPLRFVHIWLWNLCICWSRTATKCRVFLVSGEYGICLDLDWWFWMSVLCDGCLRLLKIQDSKVAYI